MITLYGVTTYYVSVMAVAVYYFFASFSKVLPWSICGPWASDSCVNSTADVTSMNSTNTSSAAAEYFKYVFQLIIMFKTRIILTEIIL